MRRHEYWLDYMRGIAASVVVVFHANEDRTGDFGLYTDIVGYGWLGVPMFFFISGYCIHLSAQTSPSAGDFMIRRLVRIYPPYWASLVVVVAVILVSIIAVGANDVTPVPKTPEDIVATLIAAVTPATDVQGMNWVYWTLPYELAFYGVVVIAMLYKALYQPIIFAVLVLSFWPTARDTIFFLDHFGMFALGIAAAMGRQTDKLKIATGLIILALTSILANERAPAALTGFGLAIFSLIRWRFPSIGREDRYPALQGLGRVSYSLYLVHVPIGMYLIMKYAGMGSEQSLPAVILSDTITFSGSLIVAWIMYRLVERPSIAFGRMISAGSHAKTGASVARL